MKLLADTLVGIIHVLLLYQLYHTFLERRAIERKYSILLYLLDGIFCISYSTFAQVPLQRIAGAFCFIVIPLFLYHGKISLKISLGCIFYIVSALMELLAKALLLGLSGDFNQFFMNYEYHYLLGVIISKIGTIIVIYFFTSFPKLKAQKVPWYLCCTLVIIPAFSVVIFYALQHIVYAVNTQEAYILYTFITFILLLFNLVLLFLFIQASESSWLQARLEYEENNKTTQMQYYKNLSMYHQQVRQLHHDMKNHFLLLHAFLDENDVVRAKNYLEQELKLLENGKTIYSSYLLLDTVLSYKKQLALQQNTSYQIDSKIMPELSLSESLLQDLSIILSSCLDNALEATAKLEDEALRKIDIFLYNDDNYIYFKIQNSIRQKILLEKDMLPKTTKRDTLLHGMGLRNVKKLIRKYDGELSLYCSDDIFTVAAMLRYQNG